jgi:hypothetical protein
MTQREQHVADDDGNLMAALRQQNHCIAAFERGFDLL